MSSKLFRGGVPVAPEVNRLMALGTEPGLVISYEDAEQVIGVRREETRFLTVTQAWRKRVFREHRIRIKTEGGSFRFLTASESLALSVNDMHRVGRAVGRTVVRAEAIDHTALDDREMQRHALLRRNAAALLDAAQTACKDIVPPKPVRGDTLRLARG